MKFFATALIRSYKVAISPFLPFNHCRYYPTCSDYAIEAVTKFGIAKGGWLALKRIGRCHPLSKHEIFDPVP
jgi:putative membrane protein insertion efficiency factor